MLQEVGLQHFVGIVALDTCGKHISSQDQNLSAGVSITIISQTCSSRIVIRVVDVPEEFSGRVAGIRVCRRDFDFPLSLHTFLLSHGHCKEDNELASFGLTELSCWMLLLLGVSGHVFGWQWPCGKPSVCCSWPHQQKT